MECGGEAECGGKVECGGEAKCGGIGRESGSLCSQLISFLISTFVYLFSDSGDFLSEP